jgi:hypothetical protein
MRVFTPSSLADIARKKQSHLIDGIFLKPSVNILVGDSGLGKTAFAIQLGLSVAAGLPWLGRNTSQGRVLFVDAESPVSELQKMVETISQFLGLNTPPENDFLVWSPNWDVSFAGDFRSALKRVVDERQPELVVVDSLRDVFPEAETKNPEATKVINFLRTLMKGSGTSFVLIHHLRKGGDPKEIPRLDLDPHGWLREASGARALVNQTDTRIGVDTSHAKGADLTIAGFTRMTGRIFPINIARVFDDDGEPKGYRELRGIDHLSEKQRKALDSLTERFRYRDAKAAIGGASDSNTANFIATAISFGLIEKDDRGGYVKKAA